MHSHHSAGSDNPINVAVPRCMIVRLCRLPPGLPSGHGALPHTHWIFVNVRGPSPGRLRHCQRRLHVQSGLRRLGLWRLHAGLLPAGLALLAYRCRRAHVAHTTWACKEMQRISAVPFSLHA